MSQAATTIIEEYPNVGDLAPQAQTINRLNDAVYSSFALLAGMQLDLFTPLKDGPLDVEDLAQMLEVERSKLGPLLYALVSIGLLKVEDGRFSNTAEADHFLVHGRPAYLGERHRLWSELWHATMKTAASIKTGMPQAKVDFFTQPQAALEDFLRGLHPAAMAAGRSFGQAHDLKEGATVLDVAGGSGGFALGLCEVRPDVRATVVELSHIVPITKKFIRQAATERVGVIEANLVEESTPWMDGPLAAGYDVAVLKNFLQVLAADQAEQALVHVYGALKPGGRVFVMGDILDHSRLGPADTVTFNLVFLNIYEDGQAYTQDEYRGWLIAAGFEAIEFIEAELISARRPG
jgi:cyclopropane fatty-acyl-phospholipid synthase-like methyltransferase